MADANVNTVSITEKQKVKEIIGMRGVSGKSKRKS